MDFSQQGVHVMAKPIGPVCNLDCEYCYYLHKEELYPGTKSWRMAPPTLESFIGQYIQAQPPAVEEITFAWQGGEPTLLGVEFFRRAAEIQKRLAPPHARVVNTLQTNAVLLDEEWAEFFVKHHFLIGVSIDGPAALHDRYRYDKKGQPSFEAVKRGLKLLLERKVDVNGLVVVNRVNGDHGRKVYTYLRDLGLQYLQFIPIVEKQGIGMHPEGPPTDGDAADEPVDLVSSRSVLPEQFGRFLCDVFDEWIKRDVGRVFVQIFDQALSAWVGIEPSLCVFRRECGRALAIEHNGDVYSCDHFVEPEYRLGNLLEIPLLEMANSPRQEQFGRDKHERLPNYCRECEVQFVCNGECPKNRFIRTPDGEPGLNYLCAGYRTFFNHIAPAMKAMAAEVRAGRPAANVMSRHRPGRQPSANRAQAGTRGGGSPQRNALCPCGSGRKFKKCCGAK